MVLLGRILFWISRVLPLDETGMAMTDSKAVKTIAGLLRDVEAAQEHLLIHHANMDSGHLVGDVRTDEKSYVLRDSFRSPCTSPHDCWNRLEAAARALAEGVVKPMMECREAMACCFRVINEAGEDAVDGLESKLKERGIKDGFGKRLQDAIRALQPERAEGEEG